MKSHKMICLDSGISPSDGSSCQRELEPDFDIARRIRRIKTKRTKQTDDGREDGGEWKKEDFRISSICTQK